jgi:hypothetical protein
LNVTLPGSAAFIGADTHKGSHALAARPYR